MSEQTQTTVFKSLEDILGMNDTELAACKTGEFPSEKIGLIAYTAIDNPEYKQAKKDCTVAAPGKLGKRGLTTIDDDRLMLKIIIAAVDKDTRSNFTFADAALMQKLGVKTAEAAVEKILNPGEIVLMAVDIQELSGFGEKAQEELKEDVKN